MAVAALNTLLLTRDTLAIILLVWKDRLIVDDWRITTQWQRISQADANIYLNIVSKSAMQCVGGCSCVYAVCSSCTRSCGCDSVLFKVSFVENKQFNLLKILCLSVQVEERRGNNQVIIDRFSCNERISLLLLCSDSFESLFFFFLTGQT